jgi:hypothetical protein
MGMGNRATQPAKENAADPGTVKRRAYGPKTVRGDTGFSRSLATSECGAVLRRSLGMAGRA